MRLEPAAKLRQESHYKKADVWLALREFFCKKPRHCSPTWSLQGCHKIAAKYALSSLCLWRQNPASTASAIYASTIEFAGLSAADSLTAFFVVCRAASRSADKSSVTFLPSVATEAATGLCALLGLPALSVCWSSLLCLSLLLFL